MGEMWGLPDFKSLKRLILQLEKVKPDNGHSQNL